MVTTVLIIDDHEIVRIAVRYKLQSMAMVKVVGEAANGTEGLRLAKELNPDIIFMDILMPGVDGIETARKILAYHPGIKIIILSKVQTYLYPSYLLKMGVAAYLSKNCTPEEMFTAVRNVIAGKRYVSPVITKRLALKSMGSRQKIAASFDLLSLRELQIALQLIEGKEINTIADVLHLSPQTVRVHRDRIFEKLNIRSSVALILLAKELGYLEEISLLA
ncbi:MAG: uvrY [Gammaproteobacteria bacterium]|jgi:DNA-binding NarL/FixJ family response regulator|nr:uvrY [Gammaproteobacteria bacterium]